MIQAVCCQHPSQFTDPLNLPYVFARIFFYVYLEVDPTFNRSWSLICLSFAAFISYTTIILKRLAVISQHSQLFRDNKPPCQTRLEFLELQLL